jgi:hypothetical protein
LRVRDSAVPRVPTMLNKPESCGDTLSVDQDLVCQEMYEKKKRKRHEFKTCDSDKKQRRHEKRRLGGLRVREHHQLKPKHHLNQNSQLLGQNLRQHKIYRAQIESLSDNWKSRPGEQKETTTNRRKKPLVPHTKWIKLTKNLCTQAQAK